jgi:hypothetical protein
MYLQIASSFTAMHIADKNWAALTKDSFSVGHICFEGEHEWYYANGNVCRAHKTDVIDLGTGNRQGRRMTTVESVVAYPDLYRHLGCFVGLCERGMGHLVGGL